MSPIQWFKFKTNRFLENYSFKKGFKNPSESQDGKGRL